MQARRHEADGRVLALQSDLRVLQDAGVSTSAALQRLQSEDKTQEKERVKFTQEFEQAIADLIQTGHAHLAAQERVNALRQKAVGLLGRKHLVLSELHWLPPLADQIRRPMEILLASRTLIEEQWRA